MISIEYRGVNGMMNDKIRVIKFYVFKAQCLFDYIHTHTHEFDIRNSNLYACAKKK